MSCSCADGRLTPRVNKRLLIEMFPQFHSWSYLITCFLRDVARKHLSPLISVMYLMGYFCAIPNRDTSRRLLLKSRRAFSLKVSNRLIRKHFIERVGWDRKQVPNLDFYGRFIVLKLPVYDDASRSLREKGVVLVKFTETFLPFLDCLNVKELTRHFVVVLEPSWAGYALEAILAWANPEFGKVIIFCPESDDYSFIQQMRSNLHPVDIGASDWVDDRTFYPVADTKKIYDSIYVANYSPDKRLHRYFKAISRITIPNYTAAIVCSSWGGGRSDVHRLLGFYGVSDKVVVWEDVSQSEINVLLNQSKVNMLLSLKEGANKSVFEGFFAGTPAIVLKENVGVNKQHINGATGLLVPDSGLEEALCWFNQHWMQFSSAAWVRSNIAPEVTTSKLNRVIKDVVLADGGEWSVDIVPKTNSPELGYYHQVDRGVKDSMDRSFVELFRKEHCANESCSSLRSFSSKWWDVVHARG